MALTIKNLFAGTLTLTGTDKDIVPTVSGGKSVLVENVIFVNTTGTARTITVKVLHGGNSRTIVDSLSIGANSTWVLEEITLDVGDKIFGFASAATAIDFVANGVEKDL